MLESILVSTTVTPDEIIAKFKSVTLLQAVHLLYAAWLEVTGRCFARSWRKLLGPEWDGPEFGEGGIDEHFNPADLLEVVMTLPGCGDCNVPDVQNWMDIDR